MLLNRSLSWRQRSRLQPGNQAQDLSEQRFGDSDFCLWLQADIQSPEIEVRFTPNTGH